MAQTRSEVDRMLDAFEQYYGLEYTPKMRSALISHLGNPPKSYLLELYKQTIEQIESRWGKLPDIAAIVKIKQQLPEAWTFTTGGAPELTEDAGLDPDDVQATYNPGLDGKLRDAVNARAKQDGEINHRNRERMREKVRKGEATKAEHYRIWCIDVHNGDWRAARADHRTFDELWQEAGGVA